jgi:poly(3-hydroxybutyrate) depolymerase
MRAYLAALALVGCGDDGGTATDAGASSDSSSSDSMMSVGCGAAAPPTGVINGTINVGGTDRTYLLSVPASYDPTRAYPLIFAWHGRTGTSQLARQYFGIEAQTTTNAIVVYPQGLLVSGTAGDTGWELGETQRDVLFFDALYTKIAGEYCTGTTFSMGHSFGGYMSNSLGCYRGGTGAGKVRAIASIAGGGPFTSCSGDPISAVIIHGTEDTVVLPSQGLMSRDTWRTAAGCATTSMAATPSPCIAYDTCTAGLDVRYCEHSQTAGSGHGWPSFAAPAAWQLFQDSL